MRKYDERDTMFARATYLSGTKIYEDYYKRNPDKKEIDDKIRAMPQICSPQTPTYDPIGSKLVDASFKFLSDLKQFSYKKGIKLKESEKIKFDKYEITLKIKNYAKSMGIDLVGITKTKEYFYYSYQGRHPEVYGKKVTLKHKYAIVFAKHMNRVNIQKAPKFEEVFESATTYAKVGFPAIWMAYFINELGYEAKAHTDANYLMILPLVAREAGIGVIGRSGMLITDNFGPAVRLSAVTTDLELVEDKPLDYPIIEFCKLCGLCAKSCPGRAIPADDPQIIESEDSSKDKTYKWNVNQEKCYTFWRKIGTDCGVCLKVCPFGKKIRLHDFNKYSITTLIEKVFN